MKKLLCYLLLASLVSSPNIYARSKVKIYEVDIVPPPPTYEEIEYYKFNHPQTVPAPSPCANKGRCCSSKERTDCCFRKNRKNTIENQQAYIGIATAVLLLVAALGMIFVTRDSH